MSAEEIGFGSGDRSGARATERLGWQAPLVLVVALAVVVGAVVGGVALGRQEPTVANATESTPVLNPYYAWSNLMTALSDPSPPADRSAEATIAATRAYVDRFRKPSGEFTRALEADTGPYDFYEFPSGAPDRGSLVLLDDAIARYARALDTAASAAERCIEDGTDANVCVEDELGSAVALSKAAAAVESAYRDVVEQATRPEDFLG